MPVLGWRHDWFPAFYTRSSGLPVPHRVESAAEVAAVLANRTRPDGGVLLAVPIPADAELDPAAWTTIAAALADAAAAEVAGAAVTPLRAGAIAAVTAGDSVPANLALAEHNAAVAGAVAVAISSRQVDAVAGVARLAGRHQLRELPALVAELLDLAVDGDQLRLRRRQYVEDRALGAEQVPDLGQREAQVLRPPDERQAPHVVGVVLAVAGACGRPAPGGHAARSSGWSRC